LWATGDIPESRAHFDQAIALYDPAEHRPLATRFGQDAAVSTLCMRSFALWHLGHPGAALIDSDKALGDAREIGQAATLIFALHHSAWTHILRGNYAAANAHLDENVALADEKGAAFFKAFGVTLRGCVLALTGKASDAVRIITSGLTAFRSTGATMWEPLHLSFLAKAYADLGQFDNARRCVGEAIAMAETTGERWYEAELHRISAEIELLSPERDAAEAQAHFQRALEIARAQQARSWELRAAMSMARLWREQSRRAGAHDLLAPVYGWFTEGFDTADLKNAKALPDRLA